ncbi:MAG: LuxR C-terminal-related transcriptional regulator [Gaiellaceae bacterium]
MRSHRRFPVVVDPGVEAAGSATTAVDPGAGRGMTPAIRVAVIEELEIFRRGLVSCLAEEGDLVVTVATDDAPLPGPADIAVVSAAAARRHRFECPIVVCSAEREGPRRVAAGNVVTGVLHRGTMTEAQLRATVRAAAAGLRVNADAYGDPDADAHDPRAVRILELLADGHTTREIADDLSYSERTIKKRIQELGGC